MTCVLEGHQKRDHQNEDDLETVCTTLAELYCQQYTWTSVEAVKISKL